MAKQIRWSVGSRIPNTVLHYLGVVMIAFSGLQAAPLVVSVIYGETVRFPMRIYVIPAAVAVAVGLLLVFLFRPQRLTAGSAMAIGALGWLALSLVGAIPYWLALDVKYVDALFEATSGFTTTGATVLQGLAGLPKSILLWRALTEWIGGLGIFTLFLFVIRGGSSARRGSPQGDVREVLSRRIPLSSHSLDDLRAADRSLRAAPLG
jgi:trk system potassium uptake protein TrkH